MRMMIHLVFLLKLKASVLSKIKRRAYEVVKEILPRCGLYLAELIARADTSLSDSEPSVSYSVIGM